MFLNIKHVIMGLVFLILIVKDLFAGGAVAKVQEQQRQRAMIQQQAIAQAVAQQQAQLQAQQRVAQQQAIMQQAAVQAHQGMMQQAATIVQQRTVEQVLAQKHAVEQQQAAQAIIQKRNFLAQQQAEYLAQQAHRGQVQQANQATQMLARRNQQLAQRAAIEGQMLQSAVAQQRQAQQAILAQTAVAKKRTLEQAGAMQMAAHVVHEMREKKEQSQVKDIVAIEDLWSALEESSESWTLIIDPEPKALTVARFIEKSRQEGISIKKEPSVYVQMIDGMSAQSPQLLQKPFDEVLKLVAIIEYDYDNGVDKDKLALAVLGEKAFWANKQRMNQKQ